MSRYIYLIDPIMQYLRGWIDRINSQPKRVLQHMRDQLLQQGTLTFQVRILVDFYQQGGKVGVQHVVQPEYFKGVVGSIGVNTLTYTQHCLSSYCFHFGQYLLYKTYSIWLLLLLLLQILFIGIEIDFVGLFIFAIMFCSLLDSIIGEMYILILIVAISIQL